VPAAARRGELLAVGVIGAIQGLSLLTRLPGLPCPMRSAIGIPCPGCGLTRACGALISGDFDRMLRFHALAPLVFVSAICYVLVQHGPGKLGYISSGVWHSIARRVPVPAVVGTVFVGYWAVRLLMQGQDFVQLLNGGT
jgi:hypothetical protein